MESGECYNKPDVLLSNYILVRKGLIKFFDLRLSFISKEERNVYDTFTFKFDLY